MPVIPAKAGIQCWNSVISFRKSSLSHTLDSGFRRSDGVVISYAIPLQQQRNYILRQRFVLPFRVSISAIFTD